MVAVLRPPPELAELPTRVLRREDPAFTLHGSAGIDGAGDLQQGNLEQANVDAVTEISNLITAQRSYEMNSKVISAADQMLQTTNQMHS